MPPIGTSYDLEIRRLPLDDFTLGETISSHQDPLIALCQIRPSQLTLNIVQAGLRVVI
jgi:hypothetical protein